MGKSRRKPQRGGRREGAGRPPSGLPVRCTSIRVALTAGERSAVEASAKDAGLTLSAWARERLLSPPPEVEKESAPEPPQREVMDLPPEGGASSVGWRYEWLARDDKPSCGTLLIHRPGLPDVAMDLIGAQLETTESGRRLSYQDRSQVREITGEIE